MNKAIHSLLPAAALSGLLALGGVIAPAGAGQGTVISASGTVTTPSHHSATEVQIGSHGINVQSGSSHIRIGRNSVGITDGVGITRGSSTVVTWHGHPHPCPDDQELVSVFHSVRLAAGKSACDVVAVFGDSVADGDVSDSVVAIMGDLQANGSVDNSTVSVFGDSSVNGPVGGNAVAVFGDLKLGPKAHIHGQAVDVFGSVQRDPGSVIDGGTANIMSGMFHGAAGLQSWSEHCLLLGRLLAPRLDIAWAWGVAGVLLLFYALLALLFREGLQRSIQTLDEHPGASLLAAVAMTLLTPVLMLALVMTVVGILAIPLFWLALLGAGIFGRVVALGWLGGRILRGVRSGSVHPVLYVLLGGVIALALYMVPVLGFIVYALIGTLGFGAVIYSLLLALRAARGAAAQTAPAGFSGFGPAAGTVPPDASQSGAATPEASASAGTGAMPPPAPTPMELATLPRAGFWIRMLALLIDLVLISFALSAIEHHGTDGLLLVLATYGALMWKLRGTTVGGIICHLRVVRIDGQPVSWETAILRALGCFLSLIAAGLGFFWIAFDRERQAWHDKIAGTVVVLTPKTQGLV
ncbi:MAG: RDD family protein [Steroidobacteraceae bacterium]